MIEAVDKMRAIALWERLLPSLAAWPTEMLSDQVQVLLAGLLLDRPSPAALPPLLAEADALLPSLFARPRARDAFASVHSDELLLLAEDFVPAAHAPSLADRLAARGLIPRHERLAALLSVHDPVRCEALLARVDSAEMHSRERWLELVAAALLAALDAGALPPATIAAAWCDLEAHWPGPLVLPAWLSARLRVHARRDPLAALAMLSEAVDEVGAAELGWGLTSVIARAAARDRAAVWRHFAEDTRTLTHRAYVLAALGVHDARDATALAEVLAELRSPRSPGDRHPKEVWASTVALLELAAAAGDSGLGAQVVEATGPPAWTLFVATRLTARERATREQRWDPEFWNRLAAVAADAGPGRAARAWSLTPPWADLDAQTLAALWHIETLPLAELALPWWWRPDLP